MNHSERDIAIYTQVAFKAAIDIAVQNCKTAFDDDTHKAMLEEDVVYLTETLINAIEVTAAKHATATAAPQPRPSNPTVSGGAVEVVTTKDGQGQQGPLPDWFVNAAAEKGVTKVYDNRHRLGENPKLPWFKAVKDQGEVPFWPPRGGK